MTETRPDAAASLADALNARIPPSAVTLAGDGVRAIAWPSHGGWASDPDPEPQRGRPFGCRMARRATPSSRASRSASGPARARRGRAGPPRRLARPAGPSRREGPCPRSRASRHPLGHRRRRRRGGLPRHDRRRRVRSRLQRAPRLARAPRGGAARLRGGLPVARRGGRQDRAVRGPRRRPEGFRGRRAGHIAQACRRPPPGRRPAPRGEPGIRAPDARRRRGGPASVAALLSLPAASLPPPPEADPRSDSQQGWLALYVLAPTLAALARISGRPADSITGKPRDWAATARTLASRANMDGEPRTSPTTGAPSSPATRCGT